MNTNLSTNKRHFLNQLEFHALTRQESEVSYYTASTYIHPSTSGVVLNYEKQDTSKTSVQEQIVTLFPRHCDKQHSLEKIKSIATLTFPKMTSSLEEPFSHVKSVFITCSIPSLLNENKKTEILIVPTIAQHCRKIFPVMDPNISSIKVLAGSSSFDASCELAKTYDSDKFNSFWPQTS
jgi:hypothetical protein